MRAADDGPRRRARNVSSSRPAISTTGRVAGLGALVCTIALVTLILLRGASTYTLNADFQNASGLVKGNLVMIGPAQVGSVKSIALTANGEAQVTLALDSSAGSLRQGTIARIYEASLSGNANKYVTLEPGPRSAPTIPNGGLIGEEHTYSEVALDQVFDTFDPLTRAGLSGLIRGQAASIKGRGADANRLLRYLAPGLSSTSQVTAELSSDEPAFDGLLTQGAQALQTLAAKGQELTALIADTNRTAAAIAGQSNSLQQTLRLLPPTLTRATSTFAGLRTTLDSLDPVVSASKVGAQRLPLFANRLLPLVDAAIPTVKDLSRLIGQPGSTDGLLALASQAPGLARVAGVAFPDLIREMNDSQHQLDSLREYTPDVVAALTNLGQASGYYDANGHYLRAQPIFDAFGLNSANQLTTRFPSQRYEGLEVVSGRCPGGAVQPPPDRSAPQAAPGCKPTATPPGP